MLEDLGMLCHDKAGREMYKGYLSRVFLRANSPDGPPDGQMHEAKVALRQLVITFFLRVRVFINWMRAEPISLSFSRCQPRT